MVDRIHKQVKVLLHLCNTTSLKGIETVAVTELKELQQRVEWGEGVPAQKNNSSRK